MEISLHHVLIKYVHVKLKCVAYLKSNHVTQSQSANEEKRDSTNRVQSEKSILLPSDYIN